MVRTSVAAAVAFSLLAWPAAAQDGGAPAQGGEPAGQGRPVPPPLPAADQYFAAENGAPVGPFTLQQMIDRIRTGATRPSDLVWKAGTANWERADSFAELRAPGPPPLPKESRHRELLLGTWELRREEQGIAEVTTTTYAPDGSYSGVVAVSYGGMSPVLTPIGGKWSVASMGDDRFTLTLEGSTPAPRRTAQLKVLDRNTLELVGTGLQARRID
jgi:GYF domain 2